MDEVYSGIKPDSPPWLLDIYLNVRSEELILHQVISSPSSQTSLQGHAWDMKQCPANRGNPFNKLNTYKDYETIFFSDGTKVCVP